MLVKIALEELEKLNQKGWSSLLELLFKIEK
jgi:hypothetical protein